MSRTSPSSERRLRAAHAALDPDQRLAVAAALALAVSLFLPWWRDPLGLTTIAVRRLSFVEVALMLVAGAVLALMLGRAEGRPFHLPLSDGTLLAAGGTWATLLVLVRMLDPPSRTLTHASMTVTRDYGIRWGALVALASAVTLAVAGTRTRRRRHRGESEAVAADADATPTLPLER
jgi:hypothetical protein